MQRFSFLFAVFLLCIPFWGISQNTLSNESLQDSIQKYYNVNAEAFLKYASILENSLQQEKHYSDLIRLKNKIGLQLISQNRLKEAKKELDEAIDLAAQIHNDKLKAISYKSLGALYFQKDDFINAIKYYSYCDSLAQDRITSFRIKSNYASVKRAIGEYEEALDIRRKLYKELDTVRGGYVLKIVNFISIINLNADMLSKNPEKKSEYLDSINKYAVLAKKLSHKNDLYYSLILLSELSVSIDAEPHPDAHIIKQFDSISDILNKKNFHFIDAKIYLENARYYYKIGAYKKALTFLKKIDYLEHTKHFAINFKEDKEKLYSDVYKVLGKNALAMNKLSLANRILIEKERQRQKVAKVLRDKYDYKAINQKIRNLKKQVHKTHYLNMILYGLVFALLLLVFYTLYNRRKLIQNYRKTLKEYEIGKQKTIVEQRLKPKTTSKINIPEEVLNKILKQLKNFEGQDLYLSSKMSLDHLAKYVKSNKVYTSKVLNDYLNLSYKEYIDQLRIKRVIKKLTEDAKFRAYTIEAIADETGYNSVITFTRAFKIHTGISVSQYVKQLKKNQQSS